MRRREIEQLLEKAVAEALNVDLAAVKREQRNAVARKQARSGEESARAA